MTIWVGPQSAGAANGTSWANRYGSLNDAEDDPVAAGETVWVGAGVYREQLTCDVSGNAGNPITYIGDVTGENTDGVGGIVRITGSDDDTSAARAICIAATGVDYRIFRGFHFDTATGNYFNITNGRFWDIEDCTFDGSFQGSGDTCIFFNGTDQTMTDCNVRRCVFLAFYLAIRYADTGEIGDCNSLIENCLFLSARQDCISSNEVFGYTVRNCLIMGCVDGVDSEAASVGAVTAIRIENCSFVCASSSALESAALGDIVENYNNFTNLTTARSLVDIGANSQNYPIGLLPPIMHSGVSQASGFKFPWWAGSLSEWSPLRARRGAGTQPLVDLHGIERPFPESRKSWGPVQFAGVERSIAQAHSAVASELHYRPSRKQFFAPTDGTEVTVSAWVYREANYRADRNPGFVLKQPGAADRATRDAGAVAQWNQITDTFTPNSTPPWFMIELVNDNYYSTTTSTTTATSTTQTETSTSTTTSTTTLNVYFDDIGLT
jgi:hypothetical protein